MDFYTKIQDHTNQRDIRTQHLIILRIDTHYENLHFFTIIANIQGFSQKQLNNDKNPFC